MRTRCAGWLKAVDEMTSWRASADKVCWMAQGCRRDEEVGTIGCLMAQRDAIGRCVSEMRSFKGLKEDGSDDGQLELIGSTCALESTISGFRASFTRQKAIEPILMSYCSLKQ